jgi:hypothetical protein
VGDEPGIAIIKIRPAGILEKDLTGFGRVKLNELK